MNTMTVVAAFLLSQTAEVRYLDGSNVVMTFEDKEVEIQTKYGKLAIPFSDVRRIDIGVAPSKVERENIDKAIRSLGGQVYKGREDAKSYLLNASPNAYQLLRDFKSDDLEISKRQTEILKLLEDRLSDDVLKRPLHSVIHAAEFTVSGQIVGERFPAWSRNFGRQEVLVGDVLAIVFSQASVELTVDHKSVSKWLDTGIQADSRMSLKITAEGQVDLWPQEPGRYMVGPQGYTSVGLNSSFMAGQLIGRIGEKGTSFAVGQSLSWSNYDSGRLYLQIAPAPWAGSDPVGSYRVRVKHGSR